MTLLLSQLDAHVVVQQRVHIRPMSKALAVMEVGDIIDENYSGEVDTIFVITNIHCLSIMRDLRNCNGQKLRHP